MISIKKTISINTFIIFIFIFSTSCKTGKNPIKILPEIDGKMTIEGYEGFRSFQIDEFVLDSSVMINLNTDYTGFALMIFETGQRYPLIIDGNPLVIKLADPDFPPEIKNSRENDFLYSYMSNYKEKGQCLMLLNEIKNRLEDDDPFIPEIEKEEKHLNNDREQLQLSLNGDSTPVFASTIMKGKQIMESSGSIKTSEDLTKVKTEFRKFIANNYGLLKNSDILMELGRQYMMMNEYVTVSKSDFISRITGDVGDWIDMLKGRVDGREIVAFFAETFFNRSMAGYAGAITNQYSKYVFCNDKNTLPPINVGEVIEPYKIEYIDGKNRKNISDLKGIKVMALVSEDCVFSKIESINSARAIVSSKKQIQFIVAPMETLSDIHRSIDKMFTGKMYFINDENWDEKVSNKKFAMPLFILLDTNNKVMGVANSRAGILNLINGIL